MELLKDSAKRTTLVQWPTAVDARLETLLGLLAVEGVEVSRAQLLAALVAEAPLDGNALGRKVRAYRRQRPEIFTQATEAVGELPKIKRPGARRKTSG